MNLKELAQMLELSQTTVSRALNGYPEVSEATRRRVLSAAQTYDYRPNPRAKGLATGQAMAIAHIIPMTSRDEIVNPIFADFVAGAGEVYTARGYDMMLTFAADDKDAAALRDLVRKGSADGAIVHAPRIDESLLGRLNEAGLPFVVHGRSSDHEAGYSWVDMDNRRAFARATDFLLDLGHRRIGLINGPEGMDFAHRRRGGYEDSLRARGLSPDPELRSHGVMTEGYGYRSAETLLALAEPPTAILASSLISALGVRRAIEDAGLRMGQDVSVISHDDDLSYLRNGEESPIFTTTRSSVRDAGRKSAEMLLRLIDDPALPPQTCLLPAALTVGGSTGPSPALRQLEA
ncbi:MAG: LacI family DNA-binding transcriptional regulator [Pseudomonadota bacterium]